MIRLHGADLVQSTRGEGTADVVVYAKTENRIDLFAKNLAIWGNLTWFVFTHHIKAKSSRSPVHVYPRLASTMMQVSLNRLLHAIPRLEEDGLYNGLSVSTQESRSVASSGSFDNLWFAVFMGFHS